MDRRMMSGAATVIVALAALGAWRMQTGGSPAVTVEDTTSLELDGPAPWSDVTLRVRSVVGDVTVVGDPDADGVTAELVRIAGGRNQAKAEALLAASPPRLAWSDDRTQIIAETDRPLGRAADHLRTTWRFTVPAALGVSVRTDVGVVDVQRLAGETNVRTDVGDITVVDGGGPVTAVADVGDVSVMTSGAATARTDVGRVWINGVEQASADADG
jgi:hypothetical protein